MRDTASLGTPKTFYYLLFLSLRKTHSPVQAGRACSNFPSPLFRAEAIYSPEETVRQDWHQDEQWFWPEVSWLHVYHSLWTVLVWQICLIFLTGTKSVVVVLIREFDLSLLFALDAFISAKEVQLPFSSWIKVNGSIRWVMLMQAKILDDNAPVLIEIFCRYVDASIKTLSSHLTKWQLNCIFKKILPDQSRAGHMATLMSISCENKKNLVPELPICLVSQLSQPSILML